MRLTELEPATEDLNLHFANGQVIPIVHGKFPQIVPFMFLEWLLNCLAVKKNEKSEEAEVKKEKAERKEVVEEDEAKEMKAKKNTKEGKSEEEIAEEERKNTLKEGEELAKKEDKENSKKKIGEEFFNSLNELSAHAVAFEQSAAPAPSTREERANRKKAQIAKQFA